MGRRHRYGYTSALNEHLGLGATCKHDFETGETVVHDHGPGRGASEAAFVPRGGSGDPEDAGWLLAFVHDDASQRSEVVVLNAQDLSRPPQARVLLPERVPYGFHGNWLADGA